MIALQPKALMLSVGLAFVSSCTNAQVKRIDLCTVVANPATFDHQVVQLHARIESDGIENTVLKDVACPEKGVSLSISNEAAKRPDVNSLFNAIFREGRIGTVGKDITATVSGVFLFTPHKPTERMLILESVSDLKVSMQP